MLLAMGEISIFYIVSEVKEIGLNLALRETLKTGFLAKRRICILYFYVFYSKCLLPLL